MAIFIGFVPPSNHDYDALVQASLDYAATLYPVESNHGLGLDALLQRQMTLYGVTVDGVPTGCGGFWQHNDYVELKSLWVDPSARGLGLGKRLVLHIEKKAARFGNNTARLETGVSQPEALGLYRKLGYVERGPFGDYKADPLSVFMEKQL